MIRNDGEFQNIPIRQSNGFWMAVIDGVQYSSDSEEHLVQYIRSIHPSANNYEHTLFKHVFHPKKFPL